MRTDIQVLRGIAIVLVLLFHARLGIFQAGYLGVDVFFVISGFLITSLVSKRVVAQTFSFSEFYLRRAKRLLPAAYVTFLVVAFLSPYFLMSRELRDLYTQLVGAITLTGNIALWRQTGYFEGSAELKPLLHVWSLAIEEQYYLLMPALLYFVPSRFWRPGVLLVFFGSLAACLVLGPSKPSATFYLLPTRAWELTIGSLGALFVPDHRTTTLVRWLFWPSLLGVTIVPALTIPNGPPGLVTISVCAATLVIIMRRHPIFEQTPLWWPLVGLGNISYSLYLAHWPIIAFLNNCWVGDMPYWLRSASALVSVLVAWLLYRGVEKPLHYMQSLRPLPILTTAMAATAAIALSPSWTSISAPNHTDYDAIRRVNYGFGESCEFKTNFVALSECKDSEHPTILVWGDSFAMHLVPGIAAALPNVGTLQATRSVCGPFLGMAPLAQPNSRAASSGHDRAWAEHCIDFNDSVLAYLKQALTINTVVLSSPFSRYLKPDEYAILDRGKEGLLERSATEATAIDGIQRTVHAVRALGKNVVVVAPPPSAGFDIGVCLERLLTGRVSLGPFSSCRIPLDVYRSRNRSVLSFLRTLQADVAVLSFDSYLCTEEYCDTTKNGIMLYRDSGHLSIDGSRYLSQKIELVKQIQAAAR